MADPDLKLVKVNDLGVVAFPSAMPDDKISTFIKKHRESAKTTEESERARQRSTPLPMTPAALKEKIKG